MAMFSKSFGTGCQAPLELRGRFWPYVVIDAQNVTVSLPTGKRFTFLREPPADSSATRTEWLWFSLLQAARAAQVDLGEADNEIFDVVRKKIIEHEVKHVPAMVSRDKTDRE